MSTTFSLRPYQQEAGKAVFHEWKEGSRKTLLVLPTGTGKTIVFANIAKVSADHGQRVLILAHRGELLLQAKDKIKNACGLDSAVEKAEETAVHTDAKIVIASMQTMAQNKRLHRYSKDAFGVIILDEAHHALSDSYQKIFHYFEHAFVLGVTATAERGDRRELGSFFDSLAYEYTLIDAVHDGYLVPLKAVTIPLRLDIGDVRIQNGDFQAGALGEALQPYLEKIATEMEAVCRNRRTIVFLPLIKISLKFTEILNQHGFKAVEINGGSSNRQEILKDFEDGRYNVICNSMLLTEGFDCPPIDCVVVLRPTRVRGLYAQMIGRGTRLSPGKKELLILDFLWMSEKHDLIHPASLIAKNEEIEKRITHKLESGEEMNLEQAAKEAEEEIIEERKQRLARELKMQRDKQRRVLNPLEVGVMLNDTDITDYSPVFLKDMDQPTEKQLAALERFGMDPATITSKGEAALLIKKLISRSQKHLSTLKQIRFLDARGFKNVYMWTFDEASSLTSIISGNHWKIPEEIDPDTYIPDSLQHRTVRRKKKK